MSHQQHSSSMVFMAIAKLAALKDTTLSEGVSFRAHIGIALNIGTLLMALRSTNAQLIPDNTLGTESTVVTPESSEQFLIEGGAARDSNLFHSFSEFNIDSGQQVNFANPDGIANILTRVTGNNASSIFGTLGLNGDANLFLINPNGIIFGENASIDINGSFSATTADSINFSDSNSFSAVNPAESLLTVNIPLGVQFGNNPASINAIQANINAQDVTLLGGDIDLKQTNIDAPGGEVKLGSLAEAGTVDFNADFPFNVARGDISLSDRSNIDVIDGAGGDISINANNFDLTGESYLKTGIGAGLGDFDAIAGNIKINAIGNFNLREGSLITNILEENSLGNGGNINIETNNLTIEDSETSENISNIKVATFSSGDGGMIAIDVKENLEIINHAPLSPFSLIPQDPPPNTSVGNRRLIPEKTGIQTVLEGNSSGSGGSVDITAKNIVMDGSVRIYSNIKDNSTGNGGAINIDTERLTLTDSANIAAHTSSFGDGGEVNITATESIELIGIEADTLETFMEANPEPGSRPFPTGLGAVVIRGGTQGNGGEVNVTTKDLSIRDGALISVNTYSAGDGGDINITASDRIVVSGQGAANFASGINSGASFGSTGNGGNLSINTGVLIIEEGAGINASTLESGNSGNIFIRATDFVKLGIGEPKKVNSITAQVGENASGKGGNIDLETKNLFILDGSQISAATLGSGAGGNVRVSAAESIEIEGFVSFEEEGFSLRQAIVNNSGTIIPSGIFASSPGLGNADAVNIETGNLTLSNRATISVNSQQQGAAGNLSINADNINLANSVLSAETVEGENANIVINTSSLQLSDRSLITTNATQAATGGNIAIDTDTLVALNDSDITANATDNFGGQVSISAQGVFGTEVREFPTSQSDITATSSLGTEFSGIVELDISNTDPTKGIIKLPENFIDATQQIAASCNLERDNNFVITGRGGVATSPQEFLRGQNILQDWRVSSMDDARWTADNGQFSTNEEPSLIQEAEKWIVNSQGKVELVASGNKDGGDLWSQTIKCGSTS